MPVPSSGAISLNQFHVEAGGTSGTQCSLNDSDIRGLIGKASGATMAFNEWYGASSSVPNQVTGNLVYNNLGGKYNNLTWTMSSFTDSNLNGSTVSEIIISTSTIISVGEIRIAGNVSSYSTLQALVGYRYMKIGSSTILDLSSQGAVTMYISGLNVTKFPNILYQNSPAQSTQTTTFTFTN
tara:strand:+ start:660 stop:1205 length:546 start_codon:yes stop_codon:yes gene_type:complete